MTRQRKRLLPDKQVAPPPCKEVATSTTNEPTGAEAGPPAQETEAPAVEELTAELAQIEDPEQLGVRAANENHELERITEARVEQQVRLALTLARARAVCPSGKWKDWVSRHTSIKRDMADVYARAGRMIWRGELTVVTITTRGISNAVRRQISGDESSTSKSPAACAQTSDRATRDRKSADAVDRSVNAFLRAFRMLPPERLSEAFSKVAEVIGGDSRPKIASAMLEQAENEREFDTTIQHISSEKLQMFRNALRNYDDFSA